MLLGPCYLISTPNIVSHVNQLALVNGNVYMVLRVLEYEVIKMNWIMESHC